MKNAFLLLALLIFSCRTGYQVKETSTSQYLFSDTTNVTIDSSIYSFIAPYRTEMEGKMSEILAHSSAPLERGLPESRLGNYVSDACLGQARKKYPETIDFSFFNNGGLRKSLPSGPITLGDVYQLMPFENSLVVLQCDGSDVEKIINFIASKGGGPVGGIRFSISNGAPNNITIGDQPFDGKKKYRVLTSDYLANGGDNFSFLTGLKRDDLNLKVRDAIIDDLRSMGMTNTILKVNTDGRIVNVTK